MPQAGAAHPCGTVPDSRLQRGAAPRPRLWAAVPDGCRWGAAGRPVCHKRGPPAAARHRGLALCIRHRGRCQLGHWGLHFPVCSRPALQRGPTVQVSWRGGGATEPHLPAGHRHPQRCLPVAGDSSRVIATHCFSGCCCRRRRRRRRCCWLCRPTPLQGGQGLRPARPQLAGHAAGGGVRGAGAILSRHSPAGKWCAGCGAVAWVCIRLLVGRCLPLPSCTPRWAHPSPLHHSPACTPPPPCWVVPPSRASLAPLLGWRWCF